MKMTVQSAGVILGIILFVCSCSPSHLTTSGTTNQSDLVATGRQTPKEHRTSEPTPVLDSRDVSLSKVPVPDFTKIIGTWVDNHKNFLRIQNVEGRLKITAWSERVDHRFSITGVSWDGHTLRFVLNNLTIDHRVRYRLSINDRGYLGGTFDELKPPGMVSIRGEKAYRKVR